MRKKRQSKPSFYRKPVHRVPKLSMTIILIIINVLFFIVTYALGFFNGQCSETVCKYIALTPSDALQGHNLWTIVTTMFAHANFLHLFVNMLSLFFLGSFLERLIGKKRFFMVYMLTGIVASLFFVALAALFGQDMSMPAVGASGAIFGLGGVLALLTPRLPVYIFFIPIAMPLWIGIVVMLAVLWVVSAVAGVPIGNTAHLGGFVAGILYGLFLRLKYKRKVRMLDRMFR